MISALLVALCGLLAGAALAIVMMCIPAGIFALIVKSKVGIGKNTFTGTLFLVAILYQCVLAFFFEDLGRMPTIPFLVGARLKVALISMGLGFFPTVIFLVHIISNKIAPKYYRKK